MITLNTPDWNSDNSAELRNFLKTETGQRFFPKLADSVPQLLAGGDINAILIRSGAVLGFQECLRSALTLAFPPVEEKIDPTQINYPSLTADEAWNDGDKIKTD